MQQHRKNKFGSTEADTTNLYVGNLCPTINEELLHAYFAPFGTIASVKTNEIGGNVSCSVKVSMKDHSAFSVLATAN